MRAIGESLLGRLGMVRIHLGDILALLSCLLPALWFVALHLVGDPLVGDCYSAQLGPDRIPIGVIAVMVSVEDILDGLGRDFLGIR